MRLSAAPWTVARRAPLSMEFFRQEYWSEWPFPTLGDLLDLGIEHTSPTLADGFFTASATWEAHGRWSCVQSRWLPGAVHLRWVGGGVGVGNWVFIYLQVPAVEASSPRGCGWGRDCF